MALEHAREAVAHLRASVSPTAIVRVMSVVPSSYCPPLSMRKMPRAILRFDARRHPVMRDRRIRPGGGDRRERNVLQQRRSRGGRSPAPRPRRSRSGARSALPRRTRRGSARAPRRRADARRARRQARPRSSPPSSASIGSAPTSPAAGALQRLRQTAPARSPRRRRALRAASRRVLDRGAGSSAARRHARRGVCRRATGSSLRAIDDRAAAVPRAGRRRKPSGSGVWATSAAADVEQPGEIVRVADEQPVGFERGAHAARSSPRALSPAKPQLAGRDRRRAAAPGGRVQIASIGLASTRDKLAAGALAGRGEALRRHRACAASGS